MRHVFLCLILIFSLIAFSQTGAFAQSEFIQHTLNETFDGASSVIVTDVDIDGDLDIIGAAYYSDDIILWLNDGEENFSSILVDNDFEGVKSVQAADLDGDGDIDIVAAAELLNSLHWWENINNQFEQEHVIDNSAEGINCIVTVDFDQDNNIDIVGSIYGSNEIGIWSNDGTGEFELTTIEQGVSGIVCLSVEDVDNDEDLDIVGVSSGEDEVAWWENVEYSYFDKHVVDDNFNLAHYVQTVDLDGDNDIDILGAARVGNPWGDGDITWWENNGTPEFSEHLIEGDYGWAQAVGTADLDNDGDLDIIGLADQSDEISWWENDGDQNFTLNLISGSYFGGNSIFVADIDLDGDADFATTAFYADEVTWWQNVILEDLQLEIYTEQENIVIPPGGATFRYELSLLNTSDSDIEFDAWSDLITPDNEVHLLDLYEDRILYQNSTFTSDRNITIDQSIMAGPSTYVLNIGEYPDNVFVSGQIPVKKITRDLYLDDLKYYIGNESFESLIVDKINEISADRLTIFAGGIEYGQVLDDFITLVKDEYGIQNVGIMGQNLSEFYLMADYFVENQDFGIDYININFDFWSEESELTFIDFMTALNQLVNMANALEMEVELTLGLLNAEEAEQLDGLVNNIAIQAFAVSPDSILNSLEACLSVVTENIPEAYIWPVISMEDMFMGDWLNAPNNSMNEAEQVFWDDVEASEYTVEQIGGIQWLSYPQTGLHENAYYRFEGNADNDLSDKFHGQVNDETILVDGVLRIGANDTDRLSVPSDVIKFGSEDPLDVVYSISSMLKLSGLNDEQNTWINCSRNNQPDMFMVAYDGQSDNWFVTYDGIRYDFAENSIIEDYNWHHIVLIREQGAFELFIDSTQVGLEVETEDMLLEVRRGGFIFGQQQGLPGVGFLPGRSWNGEMDNIRIYNTDIGDTPLEIIPRIDSEDRIPQPSLSMTVYLLNELPIHLPSDGGLIELNAVIINNTGNNYQSLDSWIEVNGPDNSVYGPRFIRENEPLLNGTVSVDTVDVDIPPVVPSGDYTLLYKFGSYPDVVVDEWEMTFYKLPFSPNETQTFQLSGTDEMIEMIWVPPGEFWMGSPENSPDASIDEFPEHLVTLEYGFWMSKYEVTQQQWTAIMGDWNFRTEPEGEEDHPADLVSWMDVQYYLNALNEAEQDTLWRFPSEAEWEYACRAGTDTRFSWGDDDDFEQLPDNSWYGLNSDTLTHPVGQKLPNPWGFYDMYGNVAEWVQDWYHTSYDGAPRDGSAWLDPAGIDRVRRGGHLRDVEIDCRARNRRRNVPWIRLGFMGLRLVRNDLQIEKNLSNNGNVPEKFAIDKIYPNPFNSSAIISVALPESNDLKVSVYNLIGQQVAVLADNRYAAGYHNLVFNGSGLASGIYFIKVAYNDKIRNIKKIVLIK